jgi:hypothetical protein
MPVISRVPLSGMFFVLLIQRCTQMYTDWVDPQMAQMGADGLLGNAAIWRCGCAPGANRRSDHL